MLDDQEVNLAAGETLFAEGDPGEEAYVIAEGEIEIVEDRPGATCCWRCGPRAT